MADTHYTDASGTPDVLPEKFSSEVERQREAAAKLLRRFSLTLRRIPARDKAGRAVHSAKGKMQEAAHYVQEHYLKDAGAELDRLAKRRPAVSLLVAIAAGYVAGRVIRGVLRD